MARTKVPIKRRRLSDEVQERLIELIQSEKLKPGAPLPSERELMAEYQVGRPAIREAMQNLQRFGLVDIKHGERPKVSHPSLQALMDPISLSMNHLLTHSDSAIAHLKEARLLYECQIVRIAAERRTKDDLNDLERILELQDSFRHNAEAFMRHDGLFHERIAKVSGNPLFVWVSSAVFEWLSRFHLELVRKPGFEKLTLAEHRTIFEHISASDPDAAQKAMTDHLNRANTLYHQDNLNGPGNVGGINS